MSTFTWRYIDDKLYFNVKYFFIVKVVMEHIQRIKKYEDLKVLADERRLTILRLLMSKPATLSQL